MRFHLLAPPSCQTTRAYSLDGFSQATIRFARLLKELGHYVILYGSEENEAPCDEFVSVVSKAEIAKALGDCPYQYAAAANKYPLWDLANTRTIEAIGKRKEPKDFIALIGGLAQKVISDAHKDLMTIEYSIGYIGCFADYRVYESQAWRHTVQGLQNQHDGRFFDTVIPLFFDPADFPSRTVGKPFALYVGRLTSRKGLQIACQAAERAGIPLKVIGHGDPSLVTYGEYLGPLDNTQRNDYMSRAQCLLCPTQYIEPFGSVAVEAQFCGCPVVSTDFGAFTETVEHGVSGFRCNVLGDFVKGIKSSVLMDRDGIMQRAQRLYSIDAVKSQYQAYFDRLMLRWGEGWYAK